MTGLTAALLAASALLILAVLIPLLSIRMVPPAGSDCYFDDFDDDVIAKEFRDEDMIAAAREWERQQKIGG